MPLTSTPRKQASVLAVVFGLWPFSVFVGTITGRILFSTNENLMFATLGCSIVWPLAYFAISRCSFVPKIRQGQLIATIAFSVFAFSSAVISPDFVKTTVYAMLTVLAIFIAMQFT